MSTPPPQPPADMVNGLYVFANQVTPLWNWQLDYNFAQLFALIGGGSGSFTVPVTIAPTAGVPLTITGTPNNSGLKVTGATDTSAGDWVAEFHSSTATGGYQNGVLITAASGRDSALTVTNSAGQNPLLQIYGDGSGALGPYPNQLVWNTAGQFSLTGTATLPGGGGSGGVSYLSQLLDVSLTSPATNQVLTWNGTLSRWVNQTLPVPPPPGSTTLAGLTDVTLTSPASGQFLSYNGTRWVNVPAPSGGGGGGTGSPFTVPFVVNSATGQALFRVNAAPLTGATHIVEISPGNNSEPGPGLAINGAANFVVLDVSGSNNTASTWLARFIQGSASTTGNAMGVYIQAGTNASDKAFAVYDLTGTKQYFTVSGDGSGTLGASANNMTWAPNGFTFTSTNPAVPPLTLVSPPSTTAGNWLWRIGGPGASGSSPGCSNGLVVGAGTNASDYALLVQNDGSTSTYMSIKGDGSGALGPAPNQLIWNSSGAFSLTGSATLPGGGGGSSSLIAPVTISPGSGVSLTMTGSPNVNVLNVTRGSPNTATGSWLAAITASSGSNPGMSNGLSIQAGTNSADSALQVAPAVGGINFLSVRGDGLSVYRYAPISVQNVWKLQIGGGVSGDAAGCSNGIYVGAGTSVNDVSIWVQNDAGTTTYLQIFGDGSGALGPAPNQMTWTSAGVFSMTGSAVAPHAALAASPDINLTSLQDGQTLVWNAAAGQWVNAAPAAGTLAGLSDVQLSGQGQGNILTWSSTAQRWINSNVISGVVSVQATSSANLAGAIIANADGSGSLGLAPYQLVWNSQGHFTLAGGATFSVPLAGLSDVTLTSPADGQVLTYNSASQRWVNLAPRVPAIWELAGANLTSAMNGQVMVFQGNFGSGGFWTGSDSIPGPFAIGPPTASVTPLTVTGLANNVSQVVEAGVNTAANINTLIVRDISSNTGCSNGLFIRAGTNTSDGPISMSDASGSSSLFKVDGQGNVYLPQIGAAGGGTAVMWNPGGSVFRASSAARYKTNVRTLSRERVREIVASLRAVSYESLCEADRGTEYYGLIAEEVAAVEPRLVSVDGDGRPASVQYERICALLLPLVQELLH